VPQWNAYTNGYYDIPKGRLSAYADELAYIPAASAYQRTRSGQWRSGTRRNKRLAARPRPFDAHLKRTPRPT
jgi:hypothetical protein